MDRFQEKTERIKLKHDDTDFGKYLGFFLFYCESANLLSTSIYAYAERLNYFFRYCIGRDIGFHDITKNTMREYFASLKDKVSISTINGRIRTCRRAWNVWVEEEIWDKPHPMQGIKLIRQPRIQKEIIEIDTIQRILNSFNRIRFEGSRNYLMTLIFWDSMIRKGELLNLKIGDVDIKRGLLSILGKGRKHRYVPLGVKTMKYLQAYLIKWRSKFPGEHLICLRSGEPLNHRHCNQIYERTSKKLAIHVHPHLFRHSAATHWMRQSGSIAVLQGILGHSSIQITVDVYGHLTSEDSKRAYEKFSPALGLKIRRG